MPTGYYTRTEAHRQILSQTMKRIGNRPPILKGEKASNWKGGRIFRTGYIYIHKPEHPFSGKQGYIAEHRLVMEKKLGRYLDKKEIVHHINHNKTDNRIENLELCSSAGMHTKLFHPEVIERNAIINKGKRMSIATEFKKGQIPWNKKL